MLLFDSPFTKGNVFSRRKREESHVPFPSSFLYSFYKLHPRVESLLLKMSYFTKRTVSLQIANSSFVGTQSTVTLESGVEITFSSP